MSKIRIFIVDGRQSFRQEIKKILKSRKNLLIVGEACSCADFVPSIQQLKPDVIITDTTFPHLSGIELIYKIKSACPEIKILMLTKHKNEEYIYQALRHSALGYVLQDDADSELIEAIEKINGGENDISPLSSPDVIKGYINSAEEHIEKTEFTLLTPRERQILKLIGEELTCRDISKLLFISIRTVENHRRKIMEKLAVKNTVGLVKYGIRSGVIKL